MATMQRIDNRIHSISAPSTVLVIEDKAELRGLIREKFELAGFEPYQAKNGLDGLKSTACHSPAIILSERSNVADKVYPLRRGAELPCQPVALPAVDHSLRIG
jgi:hypothetical protein